ncbi:uncharacterized protein LOC124420083 isoform X1 [Lucilia cuprina]|uniref:uncharacterized protein LOC124420083 isoform X1 n=2 Tax=Lucilia cuprina TaxID=7375 RepID=UPI001F05C118|nr:uncharacterized protein LOC124420083 isoform X1 [Lucilia cuprina]
MLKIHHFSLASAKLKVIKVFLLVIVYSSLMPTCLLKSRVVHGKRFVIHVPVKIRTHHHTHTVYTHMHDKTHSGSAGKASKQTIYKIMGYSTHHTGLAAGGAGVGGGMGGVKSHQHRHHGHGLGYRHNRGGGGNGYGEINYDDFLNCDEALPQTTGIGGGGGGGGGVVAPSPGGDMIFNHFSRQDEEDYPDLEAIIDDEIGDEWV